MLGMRLDSPRLRPPVNPLVAALPRRSKQRLGHPANPNPGQCRPPFLMRTTCGPPKPPEIGQHPRRAMLGAGAAAFAKKLGPSGRALAVASEKGLAKLNQFFCVKNGAETLLDVSRQLEHVQGSKAYLNRLKTNPDTSAFFNLDYANDLTKIAFSKGTPVPNRPGYVDYRFPFPVGTGARGGFQFTVRVSVNTKTGRIHGYPFGKAFLR